MDQLARRIERVDRSVERYVSAGEHVVDGFTAALEVLRPDADEVLDEDVEDLPTGIERFRQGDEHRVGVLTADRGLHGEVGRVLLSELDPVGEIERAQAEPPDERSADPRRVRRHFRDGIAVRSGAEGDDLLVGDEPG